MAGATLISSKIKGSETKPSLVFLHGAGLDATVWHEQMLYFRGKYRSLFLELPGHGCSTAPPETDIAHYAEKVRAVVHCHPEITPYVLVGHSMGGAIVLSIALDPPDGMLGMVIAGARARIRVSKLLFRMLENDPEAFFRSIDEFAFSFHTPRNVRDLVINTTRRCLSSTLWNDFKAVEGFDISKQLDIIRLPALVLCGKEDLITPLRFSNELHSGLANSRLVVIPHAGHMAMLEQPSAFNQALENFLIEIRGYILTRYNG